MNGAGLLSAGKVPGPPRALLTDVKGKEKRAHRDDMTCPRSPS